MDLKAEVLFEDVDIDIDIEDVQHTLAGAVNEWFYPDITRNQPQVSVFVSEPEEPVRPIYCVSNLHMGNGGSRDNFSAMAGGQPDRNQLINRGLRKLLKQSTALVSGHTHLASKIAGWPVYNCGTWAEQTCSFVCINQLGAIGVFDWIDGGPCTV